MNEPLKYWNTPQDMGISKDEITEISERLWKKEQEEGLKNCHDCHVKPGELHKPGCDVERCNICGGQAISCGHTGNNEEIWTGMWPGIKECYKHKLITFMNPSTPPQMKSEWVFDLNTWEMKRRGLSNGIQLNH